MRWIILLTALSTPAFATDDLVSTYGPLLEQCYEAAVPDLTGGAPYYEILNESSETRRQCIGLLSDACAVGEEDGYTTPGMQDCMRTETKIWDEYLNKEYQAAIDRLRASDEYYLPDSPQFAGGEEALRTVQRAWMAFRDAKCELETVEWRDGSMRRLAWPSCQLQMTAERTIYLVGVGR